MCGSVRTDSDIDSTLRKTPRSAPDPAPSPSPSSSLAQETISSPVLDLYDSKLADANRTERLHLAVVLQPEVPEDQTLLFVVWLFDVIGPYVDLRIPPKAEEKSMMDRNHTVGLKEVR